ncbi:MAG: HD domain-containing protein [Pirellulaceae bacterium]
MLDLKPIVQAILADYALSWQGLHGVSHWARVLENGLRLAEMTGANADVVRLFSVFHDSRREKESTDIGHGRRGAELAVQLRGEMFDQSDTDFHLLYTACAGHEHGMIDGSVTVQTCWDADRLDLGRVGMRIDTTKLCTDAARNPEVIRWADGRAAFKVIPDIVSIEWLIETSR